MSNSKAIKNRIKWVESTEKSTKAMELLSASKMTRAVASPLASRLYAGYSWEILTSIAKNTENITNPLFNEREVNKILLVLITSNRGLCGAYNAQIIKKVLNLLKQKDSKIQIDILSVGKRGDMAMRRVGKNVIASFFEIPDNATIADVVPVAKLLVDEYKTGSYDKVLIAYTDFISGLTQKPNIRQILPISKSSIKEALEDLPDKPEQKTDYLFEGDFNMLIETLAEKITRMQIYQMLLESNASEQSSRMVAMKNASEASGEMIDDLTLVFNKARQANITREISEISAGMASVG